MRDLLKQWAETARAEDALSENVALSKLTTFAVGGPAAFVAKPTGVEELKSLLALVKEKGFPYVLLGRGSNVLAEDQGFPGLVILLSHFDELSAEGSFMTAGAGLMLGALAQAAREKGLSGLEFASGIPGTLGGALFMNAGAYGGEMSGIVRKVWVLTPENEVRELSASDMGFSYRHSKLQENGCIALKAILELTPSDPELIKNTMNELAAKRREKQPLEFPSAGSAFKRPEGYFAAALIEGANLKGVRVGGAQVSPKHAGFIVNTGFATAGDIKALFAFVKKSVWENAGVELEPEVRILDADGLKEFKLS